MDNEQPGQPRGAVRRILNALGEREHSVNEITRLTGLSQPNVSNHLARLRQRGWVVAQRRGREIHYSLAQPAAPGDERGDERPMPAPTGAPASAPAAPVLPALAAEYLAALLRLDEPRAAAVVEEALAHGYDWKAVSRRVMLPALTRVGELWAERELTVAEEHAATAMTTRLQDRLAAMIPTPTRPVGRAVVAGVAGNQHALGSRIVADYLTAAGWEAHYLGTDLPLTDLMAIVERLRPDAVLLSVSLDDQFPALRSAVTHLRQWREQAAAIPSLPLLVAGGQPFAGGAPPFAGGAPPEPGLDLQGSDPEAVIATLTARLTASRAS